MQAKSLTTPAHLVQGIIDCLRKSGLEAAAIDELIHGSTIAINTLIERKGAKTGLVVTRGTRDVYIIGRGNRPEAYNLLFHKHRRWCRAGSPSRSTSACSPPARCMQPLKPRQRRGRLPRRWPPRASRRSRSASCTPMPIPSTSASPAR